MRPGRPRGQWSTFWIGQAAINQGKPLPGKEGLTSAEARRARSFASPDTPIADGARHPGKGYGLVRRQERGHVDALFELVTANQADFPVRTLCRVLKVSPSGFYAPQG